MLSSAIQHYVLKGNLRRAATQQQYLAEVYETELGDMKKALDAYEKAAEWFDADNAEAYVPVVYSGCSTDVDSLANKHFLKVADLAALESDYYKSIEHYERIGRSSINNNLMKWSVKDYFLKAGICHLATNVCCPSSSTAHANQCRTWSLPTARSKATARSIPPFPRQGSISC